jgi:hypothetical protein
LQQSGRNLAEGLSHALDDGRTAPGMTALQTPRQSPLQSPLHSPLQSPLHPPAAAAADSQQRPFQPGVDVRTSRLAASSTAMR